MKDRLVPSPFTIIRFAGRTASVNAWIVGHSTHVLLIDALRSESEAAELTDVIQETGKTLWAVFVTHGHPDHYMGLRVLRERFPDARIIVASAEIKKDIIDFSTWMESVGWLDAIPRMKPKSETNPDGFDYDAAIDVLPTQSFELPGGGRFYVKSNYPAIEAPHMTTLHLPDAGALFTADIVYNGVHAWAGAGVSRANIANWLKVIADLKVRFAHTGVTLYPGHGAPGGVELLDVTRAYLCDFTAAADCAESNSGMTNRLTALYPAYEQAGFLLTHSVAMHGPDKQP